MARSSTSLLPDGRRQLLAPAQGRSVPLTKNMPVNTSNPTSASESSDAGRTAPSIEIEVFFDFVCPWCLIGKRHLLSALSQLAKVRPDVQVRVLWRSHQLLPHIPPEGVPYQPFY